MKFFLPYAARTMLALLFACVSFGAATELSAVDCCSTIQNLQVSPASDDCCFTISGTIGRQNDCFRWWRFEEFIGGGWVGDGVLYTFDPATGNFSVTKCGPGTHLVRLLFLDGNGNVLCRKVLEYTCDGSCCDRIDGPYIETFFTGEGRCCFIIKGTVGPNWQECFKWWEYQELINGTWQGDGSQYGFADDGSFAIEKCVGTGVHHIRLVFYGPDGKELCVKEIDYTCESDCCERILGPYIYPWTDSEPGRCCFTIKGSVGEKWEECFEGWEYEEYINGTWVSDGNHYTFDPNGTFYIDKCVPYGLHLIRIVFYAPDGSIACIKELRYDCKSNCCERIQGPFIIDQPSPEPNKCCFLIKGSVGEGFEECFKWWEYQEYVNGTWVGDGTQYGFNGDGTFSVYKCVPPGTHQIRILFYSPDGEVICIKELDYTCRYECCETIQGPFIGPAPIVPHPGYCCFVINGSVGQNNNCFKWWEYQELINGTWVGDGNSYGFNPDGSFSLTKCVPYGTHQIRILFYSPQGEVICVKELTYTCNKPCCERIKGPNIYPATIQEDGRCCFTIKGSVGEGWQECFAKWEYQEFINGAWVSGGTYTFNPDGSFSVTLCRPYGNHIIRILFYDPTGQVICIKKLEYSCLQPCCERIDGPYIYPAADQQPGLCCFTIKGSVGEAWQECFKYWQYEELINGVWVNDLVNYPFNADGTFSLTKCVPYGTHTIRILFYDSNGKVICVRNLSYDCPRPCCERIDGPYIYPAANPEPGYCCYTIKGSIEDWQECFRYWQYEELINGVWVNDLVNYPINADGTFSITKCRPFGTHQIRILFYDNNGKVICRKELTYTCENECCETIDGPYIYPAANPEPNRCCFTIKGSIGECNPCFKFWQYEELINGVWVNDGVSYTFNFDGTFTITKCRPLGTHQIRILFYDFSGHIVCVKELEYKCDPTIDCCETIQGPFLQTVSSQPGRCCFIISGTIGENNPCFQSWEFERLINGVWTNDMVSYIFNADGSYSLLKCVPNGIHQMRLIFRGPHGEIVCIKNFEYKCDNDCCESIQGPFVQLISSQQGRCCWRIYGSVGLECFQSWEFERLVNGVWVNDMVSYIFNPDGTFITTKCLPSGTHTVRIIFRGFHGEILCIREFTLTCDNNCCEYIQGPQVQLVSSTGSKCCWRISGSVGAGLDCFQSWEFERLVNGVWVNDMVSYIFQPDGSFSITKCLPSGTHTVRIIFRGHHGEILCTRQFTLTCDNNCCESIDGPYVQPALSSPDQCCFTVYGRINPNLECFQSWEFERWTHGQWVNDGVSYIFQPNGSFSITKCFPAGGTYTFRIVFRGFNGEVLCTKELTYTCRGKLSAPGDAGGEATGLIQQMTAVPNPASDQVTFSYELSDAAPVELVLYNAAGEKVAVVEQKSRNAGVQTVEYNTTNLASGTYYARLTVNGKAVNVPVVIVR